MQDNEVDHHKVNTLVALASATFRKRTTDSDDTCQNQSNRSERLNIVLDAIASVCVRQPKGEVYAVGMEVKEYASKPDGIINLTIASNSEVPGEVTTHVEELWDIMQRIAKHCHRSRKLKNSRDPCLSWKFNKDSPPCGSLLGEVPELVEDIHIKAYQHSFSKFVGRVDKRWSDFQGFAELVWEKASMASSSEPYRGILHLISSIEEVGEKLWPGARPRGPVGVADVILEELVKALDILLGVSTKWRDPGTCEYWTKAFEQQGGKQFPLRRYLQKLTSLHRSVNVLLRYACSPQLRTHFNNKKLKVMTIKNKPYDGIFPSTISEWKDRLDEAMSVTPYELEHPAVDGLFRQITLPKSPRSLPIHCEVRLVLHFLEESGSNQRYKSLGYIGVSKLSCLACDTFIRVINLSKGTSFSTQGCHKKWYFPWGFPPEQSACLLKAVYTNIAEYLGKDIAARQYARHRVNSDSSAASFDSNTVTEDSIATVFEIAEGLVSRKLRDRKRK